MKIWMNVMRDMEYLLADYDQILDAWGEGGVTGLVIGPPEFNTPKVNFDKEYVPYEEPVAESFDPNPEVYRRFGSNPRRRRKTKRRKMSTTRRKRKPR